MLPVMRPKCCTLYNKTQISLFRLILGLEPCFYA